MLHNNPTGMFTASYLPLGRMWLSKKPSNEFLEYMLHKGWRANAPPVGSCPLYFLKHPEINSMTKCPWNEIRKALALEFQETVLDSGCWPWAVLLVIMSLSRAVILKGWNIWFFRTGHWSLTSCHSEIKMTPRRSQSNIALNLNAHRPNHEKGH